MKLFSKHLKCKKAFTIIELIVVIAVIGILILLAMPKFIGYVEQSRITVIRHDVKVVEGKIAEKYIDGNYIFYGWPKNVKDINKLLIEGKLYDTAGLAKELELGEYKIVPEEIKKQSKTRLPGDFHVNEDGKVYYEDNKGGALGGIGEDPIVKTEVSELENFIDGEKDWIIENQDKDLGVIYMNNKGGISDVNPYFASIAARGLLTGNVREKDMIAATSYVDWHTDMFIKTNGELDDYKVVDGKLVKVKGPDSIDAYIGGYILLVVDYLEEGGYIEETKLNQVIDIAINQWDSLTNFGMTEVSHDYKVIYLMDNMEVLSAYERLFNYTNDNELKARIKPRMDLLKESLIRYFWNPSENRYDVGMDSAGKVIYFIDDTRLYPEAISQVYNLAYNVDLQGRSHSLERYKWFNDRVDWVNMTNIDSNGFFWSELFYIAANANDIERSEKYLNSYKSRVAKSRAYPLYTAPAGWAIKGADKLIDIYK